MTMKFQNRPSHIPFLAEHRPEILLLCGAGSGAELLLTVLKCADYSITHAETEVEALNWLSRRSFQAAVLGASTTLPGELQRELEVRCIPVVKVALQRHGHWNTGITAINVRELLEALFRFAPQEWFRALKPPLDTPRAAVSTSSPLQVTDTDMGNAKARTFPQRQEPWKGKIRA
jgi:hypothetical protein